MVCFHSTLLSKMKHGVVDNRVIGDRGIFENSQGRDKIFVWIALTCFIFLSKIKLVSQHNT